MPLVGKYDKNIENILVATGFNKWGMTNAAVAAGILADKICGRENAFAALYNPMRRMRGCLGAKIINALHNILGLIKGLLPTLKSEKSLRRGEAAKVRTRQGVKSAWRDEDGVMHYAPCKCPHMGCKLEWNSAAQTWDCPCHGTRYTPDGQVLDPPANYS